MVDAIFTKGSPVEVCSDDPGFHGAWYVATFVGVVEAHPTKRKRSNKNRNRNKIGYEVKFDSLFQEDNLAEHLTEIVDPSFVRPLPPCNPRRNNVNNENQLEEESEAEEGRGGDFELFDVVDAYHLDGWWIGVVTNVIIDGEMKKYIVSFENPREEFEFERSQLRLHLDWINGRWQVPSKKISEQESADRNATQISESNNGVGASFTSPSRGALTTDSDNPTVGRRFSAKKKSQSRQKAETHAETVGAVDGPVTYNKNKNNRSVNLVEENSRGKRFRSSAGSKGNTKVTVHLVEASSSQAMRHGSLPLEQEMRVTKTCEAEDGKSTQKRKRGRPPKSLVKRPNGLLEDNQEAEKRDSSVNHEITTELEEQPLSVWYQGLHPPTISKNPQPGDALNPAIVNNHETTDYQQEWPFIKRSPIWASIESLELFQNPPQKPHFSLMKVIKEDHREGLAIAHMVTFANVVQRTSKLQLDDPDDVIYNSLETLAGLETHGFDVSVVQARLNELLSRKAKVGELMDELKEVEKEIERRNVEKSEVEEQVNEVEVKMQELQEKLEQMVKLKKMKDEEIKKLQSNMHRVASRIMDWKVAFEKFAGSPL